MSAILLGAIDTQAPSSTSIMQFDTRVSAGFPSPAEDHAEKRIDIMDHLVKHPLATYMLRVRGESMKNAGIFDNDVVIVDRIIKPRHGHIVIAMIDGEFTCKRLSLRNGRLKLQAENEDFEDILPQSGQTVEVWGVVVASIKQFLA